MTSQPDAQVGDILLGASYRKEEAGIPGGFAGVFARITRKYFERYGDHSEDLAHSAAKNQGAAAANYVSILERST